MRKSQRGMSLIEIIVTLAVVSVLMIIVYTLMEDAMTASMFGESHNDMTIMTQRVVNRMQTEVLQSRVAFQEDADGGAYRDAMQIPAQPAKWPDTLLPVFQADSTLDPDTGNGADRYAGNSLLIARQLAPLSIFYDDDGDPKTPDVEFLVDHYRFEYEYLAMNNARSFSGTGFYLDFVESRSGEYADYFQLSSLNATQLKSLIPKIQAAGISRAWDPGQPIANAFYDLTPAAKGSFSTPIVGPKIAVVSTTSLLPEARGGRISGRIEYSVAFVPAAPKQPFPLMQPIAFYSKPDPAHPKFPAGLEVKIAGPPRYRKVGMRLVMMSNYKAGKYESQQGFVTASARF